MNFERFTQVIGIESDGDQFRVASLTRHQKKLQVDFLKSYFCSDLECYQKLICEEEIGQDVTFVSGMRALDVLIRKLKTSLTNRRSLLSTLPFQLEGLVPYELDEAVAIPLFERKDPGTEVTFW